MKLVLSGIAVVTLALSLVALVALLSASSLSGSAALGREDLAASLINGGGKLAIALALVCAFFGLQHGQWRWVTALGVATAITLFSGPLSVLTGTGPLIFFAAPLVTATLALVYTLRTPNLTPARVSH